MPFRGVFVVFPPSDDEPELCNERMDPVGDSRLQLASDMQNSVQNEVRREDVLDPVTTDGLGALMPLGTLCLNDDKSRLFTLTLLISEKL